MTPVRRNILLTPGPATTTDSVKYAQVVPDICPREKEFGNLMADVCAELTRIVDDSGDYSAVLFGGSGTAAVESVISSVIGREDTVLIIDNGAYGRRMHEIAEAYGLSAVIFRSPPHMELDLPALESLIITCGKRVSHLAVVHHETTTGLLNDIASIGQICERYQIDMIVDAISSFAAIPIQLNAMNIRYLAASSNKCLQGMAGVSFVIADRRLIERGPRDKPANYYLNLYAQYQFFAAEGQMRFTPPAQTLYALKQALDELSLEGVGKRYLRYSDLWRRLTAGIGRLGLNYLGSERHHSKLVTSIIEPAVDGFDFNGLHDYLYERGFTIYPGKLEALNTFRIANIGDLNCTDIDRLLEAMEHYFKGLRLGKERTR
ncbi:2-aminoethylphosphonate--pyruvate transaminase [Paenibacillus sp. sptzw28]|uniref:2-aminoethylphosphonate aminotransferase n=1 Tax=Paenibacillus sp. sptzw28 TaxID=715179 RepID=UPI001C6DD56D|nr:2-aminoethylphosphonate--pyruvate transaminase [Paenibacillus sp. sptzw28]QYR23987.1 2-aminoethylphosphonate--pyruvate transaminase [Paenibacillus sp. sptzw28]